MLATRNDITGYIPQRAPMVMIHELVRAGEDHAVTKLRIDPENVFVWGDALSEPGLIENIAQTAAAHVGYQCSQKKIPVPVGYIAAVRDLKIYSLPVLHSEIITTIHITNRVLEVTMIEGKIEQNNHIVCTCEMRIFVKNQS